MEEWFSAYPNSILEFSNKYYSITYGTDEIMWVFYPFDVGEDLSGFVFEDYGETEIENNIIELNWREMTDDDDLDWIEIIP
jgi:hypothetical protein